MRRLTISIFFFLTLFLSAAEPIKIGVIADPHFLSEQLMDKGASTNSFVENSGKNVMVVPSVLDQVFANYLQSDIQALLVCGDITKDGEEQSHIDFLERLKPLQDKGIKVYVVPGNHDIDMGKAALKYTANNTEAVYSVSTESFAQLYKGCGYDAAMDRDKASLSYVAELNASTWLIAIDATRDAKYLTHDTKLAQISSHSEKWITGILDEARSKNIQVVGMLHWGLTEHIMQQSAMFPAYLIYDWQRLSYLFADKGMKAIFTGHFHSNDITAATSPSGNTIYDVETAALCAYPFAYRFIELDKEGLRVETRNVTSIPENPNLAADSKRIAQRIAEKRADSKLSAMKLGIPSFITKQISSFMGQVFVMHAYGDEKLDNDMKATLGTLAGMFGVSIDVDDFELDLAPADNNVDIKF